MSRANRKSEIRNPKSEMGLVFRGACCIAFLAGLLSFNASGADPASEPTVLLVVGAAGEEEYGQNFSTWAENWIKACRQAHAKLVTVGLTNAPGGTDKDRWKQCLIDEPKENGSALWIVLLGHGTYDGKETKFNLQGPDVSATELAEWLKPFHRSLAVIDSSSSSAPFIHALSAPGRVVITATQSGYEQNYARFGQFLSEAIADPNADLDKDGQTSLLEAFLSAAHRTEEFYKVAGRLATEHALVDDNGDGLGTPASWFRGIRAVKKPKENVSLDGLRAHQFHLVLSEAERRLPPEQRARRDALELTLSNLREKKGQMAEDAYYSELEKLLLELAKFYE